MFQYIVRRFLIACLTLLGITLIGFSIIALMPGDPAALQSEVQDPEMSERMYEMLNKHFGLDRPLHERYLTWLGNLLTGDFGTSFSDGRPVAGKIAERLPPTMYVATLSILVGLLFAIPTGLVQAVKQGKWFDHVSGLVLYAAFAVPSYVAAVVLVYFVGVQWDLLPFRGMTSDEFESLSFVGKARDLAAHFALITFCYTFGAVAFDSRFVRGNLLEVLRQDYIRTARAKGVEERVVIFKHAFRNTLIPVLTRLGFLLPALISGSVILEVIFNWPGLGRLFFEAILMRDYPVMMASLVITSVLVQLGILAADICYALVDPRIKYD